MPFRLKIIQGFFILLAVVIVGKLFYLQVFRHEYYYALAQKEHYGYMELPARRGSILITDPFNNDTYVLATNSTYHTVYADPTLIAEKQQVVDLLAPILFDLDLEKRYAKIEIEKALLLAKTEEEKQAVKISTDEDLFNFYKQRLLEKVSQEIRPQILLYEHLREEIQKILEKAELPGIFIRNNNLYAVPEEIQTDKARRKVAEFLGDFIEISVQDLERILKGKNRFTILKKKVSPEKADEIRAIIQKSLAIFRGIGIQEDYYRLYPEKKLAAQVLGFVNSQGVGQYGIESSMNPKLQGVDGIFSSQTDVYGNQITVGKSVIQPAIDGDDVYLTIDRSIQMVVEKKLERYVRDARADSGIVIVMDPKTFMLKAFAHYPIYDPNEYGKVFDKKEIQLNDDEINRLIPLEQSDDPRRFLLYIDKDKEEKIEIFKEDNVIGNKVYKIYENKVGPLAYRNRAVSDIYEPGSVFKVISMSAAINDNDVQPNTTMVETGPIKVDCVKNKTTGVEKCDFEIRNAQDKYRGRLTMNQVIQYSSNIGMSYVAKRLGRTLLYSYIKNFGFGDVTDIEFDDENRGKIEYFEKWAESELLTHAFGQGITVTPIQMATAIAAIANGGTLMRPYIVDKIVKENGEVIQTEKKAIRQVITKETADVITYMMVNAVENGVAPKAKVKKHFIAGKTGTAQTYKHGVALRGPGTTITSLGGFGPVDNPKFVILAVLDRPRTNEWGSDTTAPLFAEIAEFLYDYYNVPPDKN